MDEPTLVAEKKIKTRKWVFFSIFVFLGAVILGESAIPGDISGLQSGAISDLLAWFINGIATPANPTELEPIRLDLKSDSTYFGKNASGVPQIVLGTTSLLQYTVGFPTDQDNSVLDKTFEVERSVGTEKDFGVLISSNSVRLTGLREGLGYQIKVTAGETADLTSTYSFDIVARATPSDYSVVAESTTLQEGTSAKLYTTFVDPALLTQHKTWNSDDADAYLRRIYDQSLLSGSGDESKAFIDKLGVIHAKQAGRYNSLTYGSSSFDVTVVSSSSSIAPSGLSITADSGSCNLGDYDNGTGLQLTAVFADPTPTSDGVTWMTSDYLVAMVSNDRINHDGVLVKGGFVQGYRNKGKATISAISDVDGSIVATYDVTVGEALPVSMSLSSESLSVQAGVSKSISASATADLVVTFTPTNVMNRNIVVVSNNPAVVKAVGSGTTDVTLSALKEGVCEITVSSAANPSLVSTIEVTVTQAQVINESNFDKFVGWVRKSIGHFSLFFITAVFGFLYFDLLYKKRKKKWPAFLWSAGVGVSLAGISEFIQHFVPGRSGLWSDVGIDASGYLIGILLGWLGLILVVKLIERKKDCKKRKPSGS